MAGRDAVGVRGDDDVSEDADVGKEHTAPPTELEAAAEATGKEEESESTGAAPPSAEREGAAAAAWQSSTLSDRLRLLRRCGDGEACEEVEAEDGCGRGRWWGENVVAEVEDADRCLCGKILRLRLGGMGKGAMAGDAGPEAWRIRRSTIGSALGVWVCGAEAESVTEAKELPESDRRRGRWRLARAWACS